MRFLDLAAATIIGLTSVAALAVWSPAPYDSAANLARSDASLRDSLLRFLESRGTVWAQNSSVDAICSALGAVSNSSVTFSAVIGGTSCPPAPGPEARPVSVAIQLGTRQELFEAWKSAGA